MPERSREPRGILDTSVVIDLAVIEPSLLPVESVITAVTLAELSAGPHVAATPELRARRISRLQTIEATLESLPFNDEAARAYGRVYAVVAAAGQKARGARAVDLMIASIALSTGLPLYTRNPEDVSAITGIIEVHAIP